VFNQVTNTTYYGSYDCDSDDHNHEDDYDNTDDDGEHDISVQTFITNVQQIADIMLNTGTECKHETR
jgi:hypothetical protein